MAMNGIDIASYQAGIDLGAGPECDFVIVKATEGTGYVEPRFHKGLTHRLSTPESVSVSTIMRMVEITRKKQITSLIESENV